MRLLIEESENIENNEKGKNYIDILFEDKVKKEIGTYLFANVRYEYLDKMPPFESVETTFYEQDRSDGKTSELVESTTKNAELKLVLKKLQALLSSQTIPKQVLMEVNTFINLNSKLPGFISLQSLLLNINDAITFLNDACPQCLQQFGKVSIRIYYYFTFLALTYYL